MVPMPPKRSRAAPVDLLVVVERELATAFPEAEIVDRELEVADGRAVDLVGVDAHGRLLLVSVVESASDAPLLLALDALAFARRNREVLAHHLAHPRLRRDAPPIAVLVSEQFSESLLARLEGLDPDRLRCFEIRRVASKEREGTYLIPVLPAGERGESLASHDPAQFLAQVPPERRELAELLFRRLARVDESLELTVVAHSATFRLEGQLLCTVSSVAGGLEGRVAGSDHAHRVASSPEVGVFLEEVMARTDELIRPEDPQVDAALDPATPSAAILTEEEIEAFRE